MIELLIAMVVIVVLVAIALPSYKNYVIRTSRQQAQTLLLSLAGLQEKIFLNSSAYASHSTTITKAYDGTSAGGLGLTSGKTADGKYILSLSAGTATTFELKATPVFPSTQQNDNFLTIDDAGNRKWGAASW